jgi:hypothetical protein
MGEIREQPNSRISTRDPLPLRLYVLFFQAAGSLREIHYLCVFAPLRLCVLFFQAAGSLREIHHLCVDFFYLFLVGLFKELLL